jgi:hypothetical protein
VQLIHLHHHLKAGSVQQRVLADGFKSPWQVACYGALHVSTTCTTCCTACRSQQASCSVQALPPFHSLRLNHGGRLCSNGTA